MRRRFVVMAVGVIATGGCAKGSATSSKPAATPVKTSQGPDVFTSEASVASLKHARLRPRISPTSMKLTKAETVDGIFVLPTDRCRPIGAATLSGLKTQESAGIPLRDQPEARTAYCLATFRSGETDFSRAGSFSAEIDPGGSWVRADRVERAAGSGSDTPASFHMFTLWADEVGRLQRLDEARVPLTPLGSFAGVDVFAFIDDDGVATKGSPSVDVIIQRPPLKRWRVQGASFLVDTALPEARLSSCTHAWMTLPLEKGNGTTAKALVAVETETGARALRINVSSLWLESHRDAQITTRLQWHGEEDEALNLTRLRIPGVPRPPQMPSKPDQP